MTGLSNNSGTSYLLMKSAMISEIKLRLSQRGIHDKDRISAVFKYLFTQHLRDILLEVYSCHSMPGGEWEHALELVDTLVWSFTPPSSESERQQIIAALPVLIQSIRKLEKQAGISPVKINALLSDMEFHHKKILRLSSDAKKDNSLSLTGGKGAALPAPGMAPKDAELAKSILEMKAQLPDVDDIDMEEVIFAASKPGSNQKPFANKAGRPKPNRVFQSRPARGWEPDLMPEPLAQSI